jgi:CubicO group peptidase (beta-lactamase class C family)
MKNTYLVKKSLALCLVATSMLSLPALTGFIQPAATTGNDAQALIDQEVRKYMQQYHIPALSIAISKDNKLVIAKSYGMADREQQQPATNQSLYRIASLSKQITSAVIMKLVEQGRLQLSDKVFGPDAILGTSYGHTHYSKWVQNITVDELLHHTAGGWDNSGQRYNDPMFTQPGLHAGDLISYTLDNLPLDNPPGTHYAYSNFGYCVLGRVIEKLTGLPYQAAARNLVLKPCGITDMEIGGNGLQHRKPNEVMYYGQGGEDPYKINIARLDAHGGWIATATDLVRFMCHINGSANDILTTTTENIMNTGSAANKQYACGWSLNGANRWHTGSLPGTQTEQAIIKQQGNFTFAILTNTRSNENGFQHDMDRIFWNVMKQDPVWPDVDLFPCSS